MNRIFNMENGIFRVLYKMIDCIWLSLLFLISCIPVFTIGAALTALYYTVQKVLKNDRGYIASEYWHAFKTNFKQATIIWLIVLGIGLVLIGDIKIMQLMKEAGSPLGKAYILFGVLLLLEIIWCSYLFPYLARFTNTTKMVMKNAAFMAVLDFPKTLLVLVILVIAVLIVCIFPVAMFIIPALSTWLQSMVLEKVFRKYMSEEDKATEDEMNREYKN